MKLKVIFICISLIFTGNIFAQDSWKFFSREEYEGNETFYYYDTARLDKYASERNVIVKVDYVPDKLDARTQKYIDYTLENLTLNCKKNNYTIDRYSLYYTDKDSEKITDDKTLALIPKTHMDKLFNFLCGPRDKFWEYAKLYFAQSYTTQETTTAEKFSLRDNPDGISILVDMRFADSAIGMNKIELRISQVDEMLNETVISSDLWDIKPDWRFIHFDNITFPQTGLYKAALLKPDGTEMIYGFVKMY